MSWVRSRAYRGRGRGFVALLSACSIAACGPIYPPPRIRTAPPSAASSAVESDPEGETDPDGVTEPEEETETADSIDTEEEEDTEATGSADDADESEPPATQGVAPPPSASTPAPPPRPSLQLKNATGVVRYRLLIHGNPVDPARAFRCYGGCRQAPTEAVYLECLSQCPGFEVEAGLLCGPEEGIPNSVCIVRYPPAPREESTPGAVVAAVILNIVVLAGLVSICNASPSQCGIGYGYRPYARY
jgi:hypothetical protein